MASRESINRVKIEKARLSQVPIDSAETIFQGDMLVWDVANFRATKATTASAGTFIGVAETKNPIETAGSTQFLTDLKSPRINVIQKGLVLLICAESVTLKPMDKVTIDATSAQHIKKTGATDLNYIGIVDTSYGAAGKAFVSGDLVKVWIHARPQYSADGSATDPAV